MRRDERDAEVGMSEAEGRRGEAAVRPETVFGKVRSACVSLSLSACALLLGVACAFSGSEASAGALPAELIRVGLLDIEKEATYAEDGNIRETTLEYLREAVPDVRFETKVYTIPELRAALRRGEVDLFISSSGFFVEMWPVGVKDLATLVSDDFPDPNRCVAGTFFTRSDRRDIRTLGDLRGKHLVTTNPSNFMAYQIGAAEVAKLGVDPDRFFGAVDFTRNDIPEVLRRVADGQADAGVLRSCMLEAMRSKYPEYRGLFRVVGPVSTEGRCAYSTELYPGWVVAATKQIAPQAAEKIVKALFAKPPEGSGAYRWSVATDYKRVNDVFRRLKVGPFEHLKHPTVKDLAEHYWPVLAALLFGALAWMLHWVLLKRQVRLRTAALSRALGEQRRLREAALRSGEEVERLTRLGIVNELSCIYAHEMAQPLTSIGYLAKTLELLTEREAPDRALLKNCATRIGTNLRSAQAILERVRGYAKAPPSRSAPVDLRVLLDDVAQSVKNLAPDADIRIEAESAPVRGDALELRILILNLLRNAVRAVEKPVRGRSDPVVRVRLFVEGDRATLEVRNRAARPNVETIAGRLRFFSDDALEDERARGLGIGLLIVQTVAKMHRGEFRYAYVEATEEAVFRIVLPALRDEAPAGEA